MYTYELLVLATVLHPDVGLAGLVEDGEGEVLDVGLHLRIRELATNETLGVEDGVVGVHGDLVLGSITNQSLTLTESDIRKGGTVTLVVGNDLDTVILPDTDTTMIQNSVRPVKRPFTRKTHE